MMKSPRKSTIQKILDAWDLNFLALGKTRKDSLSNEKFYWEQVYNTDHTSVYLCDNNSYNFVLYIF